MKWKIAILSREQSVVSTKSDSPFNFLRWKTNSKIYNDYFMVRHPGWLKLIGEGVTKVSSGLLAYFSKWLFQAFVCYMWKLYLR